MASVTITIPKKDIYTGIYKRSEYIALKQSMSEEDFAKVALLDENDDILDEFFKNATVVLHNTIDHYLDEVSTKTATAASGSGVYPSWSVGDTIYEIKFTMPNNWPSNLISALKNAIRSYLVDNCLFQWLIVVNNESSAIYEKTADAMLYQIKKIVFKRERPQAVHTSVDINNGFTPGNGSNNEYNGGTGDSTNQGNNQGTNPGTSGDDTNSGSGGNTGTGGNQYGGGTGDSSYEGGSNQGTNPGTSGDTGNTSTGTGDSEQSGGTDVDDSGTDDTPGGQTPEGESSGNTSTSGDGEESEDGSTGTDDEDGTLPEGEVPA